MAKDYIVEEVRRIREQQAAKHAFEIKAILAAAKKRQRRSGRKVVSVASRDETPTGRSRLSIRKTA
jgi:hypothetical protein